MAAVAKSLVLSYTFNYFAIQMYFSHADDERAAVTREIFFNVFKLFI